MTTDNLFLDNLQQWIDDKQTVTLKYVAMNLDVSSNVAKQMMYEFVEKQPKNKLSVVYFVSGWLPTENRQLVALVPDTELEETKKLLNPISSVHIYSISAAKPADSAQLYTTDHELVTSRFETAEPFPDSIETHSAIVCDSAKLREKAEVDSLRKAMPAKPVISSTDTKPVETKPVEEKPTLADTSAESKPAAAAAVDAKPPARPKQSVEKPGSKKSAKPGPKQASIMSFFSKK